MTPFYIGQKVLRQTREELGGFKAGWVVLTPLKNVKNGMKHHRQSQVTCYLIKCPLPILSTVSPRDMQASVSLWKV